MLSQIEQLCLEKGIKMTEQRRIIANVIASSSDHPDVEEVYQRAIKFDARISIPTVYRTLRLFEEIGIIEKHDFKNGRARYEESTKGHHHHLIDIKTGKVMEFQNHEIDSMIKKLAKSLGYKIVDDRLELYCIAVDQC